MGSIFLGDLIEIGFLGGIQTNLKIRRSAPRIPSA